MLLPGIVRFPVLNVSPVLAAGVGDISGRCVAGFDVSFCRDVLSCENRSLSRLLSFSITDILPTQKRLRCFKKRTHYICKYGNFKKCDPKSTIFGSVTA